MTRAIQTLIQFSPQTLTRQYLNGTLPDAWYWFEIAGVGHIGRYKSNTETGSKPTIYSATNAFIGTLSTITILAEIPNIYDLLPFTKGKNR